MSEKQYHKKKNNQCSQLKKKEILKDLCWLNFVFNADKADSDDYEKHKQLIKNLIDIVDREFLMLESIKKQKDYWDHKKYQRTVAELNEMCETGSSIVYQRLGHEQFDKRRNHSFNFFDDIMAVPEVSEHLKIQTCLKIIKLFILEIDYYDGVMAADIDDTAKVKVYNIIKNIRGK